VGHVHEGRVVCVDGKLNIVRGSGYVIDIQAEEDRGDQTTLHHPSPYDVRGMTWPSGRAPQTSDPEGMMKWCVRVKMKD
jgi:hypothetical protein